MVKMLEVKLKYRRNDGRVSNIAKSAKIELLESLLTKIKGEAMKIAKLKKKYKFGRKKPTVEKKYTDRGEPYGWCCNDVKKMMDEICTPETKVIVEIGSFMGMSAYNFLKRAENAHLICIDHWKGSEEHQERFGDVDLFEQFRANMWDSRKRITPVKKDSESGMRSVAYEGIRPDIVYIDGAHDYKSVKEDIEDASRLFPDAIICGDDWTRAEVRAACIDFIKESELGYSLVECGKCWRFE
jgi:hypothetical protein